MVNKRTKEKCLCLKLPIFLSRLEAYCPRFFGLMKECHLLDDLGKYFVYTVGNLWFVGANLMRERFLAYILIFFRMKYVDKNL